MQQEDVDEPNQYNDDDNVVQDTKPTATSSCGVFFLNELPSDCFLIIASFLSLKDCLQFSSTSKSLLFSDTIHQELQRRRMKFTKPFCYSTLKRTDYSFFGYQENPESVSHVLYEYNSNNNFNNNGGTQEEEEEEIIDYHPQQLQRLPTILSRMECLHKSLPSSYPFISLVRDLILDIRNYEYNQNIHHTCNDNDDDDDGTRSHSSCCKKCFSQMLKNQYCACIKAHRLHSELLQKVTTHCHPQDYYYTMAVKRQQRKKPRQRQHRRGEGGPRLSPPVDEISVTLQQYLGDVLCAYFLMGHSVSGIIEGGISEQEWMNKVLLRNTGKENHPTTKTESASTTTDSHNDTNDDNIVSLYRRWIFLHSTLLRTVPFTKEQQVQLGIQLRPSLSEAATTTNSNENILDNTSCLIFPYAPFVGVMKSTIIQELLMEMERPPGFGSRNKRNMLYAPLPPPLRMVLNDFGHLGPTFRGRDLIRSQTIFASNPASTIVAFESWMIATGQGTNGTTSSSSSSSSRGGGVVNPFIQAWGQGTDDGIDWLLQLHTEANKTTPLTVEPHIITIKK